MAQTLGEQLRHKKPLKDVYPPSVLKTRLKDLITREKLAKLLGVTPLTASRILRGCDLKLTYALKIARLLNLTIEEVWEAL